MTLTHLEKITIVLLYCDVRTGNFGMGTHTKLLLNFFGKNSKYDVVVIKTDSLIAKSVSQRYDDNLQIIEIPISENRLFITGEDNHIQRAYAKRISEIVYPYIFHRKNIVVWANTIDHLNLCKSLKSIIDAKFIYVHHNFTWKYLIKTSYTHFAKQWRDQNISYHPVAFEYTKYQKDIAELSDKVITVTQQAGDFFSEVLDIKRDKITAIYNGLPFDNGTLKAGQSDTRKKYNISPTDKIILYCGRIVEEKGIKYLIDAFKIISGQRDDVKLLVIGDGNISDLLKRVYPYWHKIILTGAIPSTAIHELYSITDIGIMPSLQEQCSFTSIEMRLFKIPMIVSSIEGLDELFEDYFDALKLTTFYDDSEITYLSPSELASKIELLLENGTLAQEIASNGYRKGELLFSLEEMCEKYDNLFLSCYK